MVVRVDQAGHHGHARQIDHLRAGRNRDVRADVADARALDEDDLVGEDAAGFGIEQPAGANRGDGPARPLRSGGAPNSAQTKAPEASTHRSAAIATESVRCQGWLRPAVVRCARRVVARPPACARPLLNQLIM